MTKLFLPLCEKLVRLVDEQVDAFLSRDDEKYEQCRLDIIETARILLGEEIPKEEEPEFVNGLF